MRRGLISVFFPSIYWQLSPGFLSNLQHKKLISLSEQCLVDCSWGFGNDGCDGGESERAYEWIMKSGCLPSESSYGQYLMEVSCDNLHLRYSISILHVIYFS